MGRSLNLRFTDEECKQPPFFEHTLCIRHCEAAYIYFLVRSSQLLSIFTRQFRNEDTEACPGVIARCLCLFHASNTPRLMSCHWSQSHTLPKNRRSKLGKLRQSALTRSELPSSSYQKFVGHVCREIYMQKRVTEMWFFLKSVVLRVTYFV